jgi:hypothetical protein
MLLLHRNGNSSVVHIFVSTRMSPLPCSENTCYNNICNHLGHLWPTIVNTGARLLFSHLTLMKIATFANQSIMGHCLGMEKV